MSNLQHKIVQSFSTISTLLSPIVPYFFYKKERMAIKTIQNHFLKNATSKKVVNNLMIGLNCTAIALKYVNNHLSSPNAIFANSLLSTVTLYSTFKQLYACQITWNLLTKISNK